MIGFLRVVLLAVVGGVFVAFAVANRHVVEFVLDPLTPVGEKAAAVHAPLALLLFVALLAGVAIGGGVVWWGQGRWRSAARLRAKETQDLRREVDRLTQQLRAFEEPRLISGPRAVSGAGGRPATAVARSWLTH